MGEELERMHPRVYSNVSRQLSRAPFGELQDANTAPYLLHAAAKELFKSGGEISWGKVIALFAICGGLAVDIVRQGHYDFLTRLLEGAADVIDEDLAVWIGDNGSWVGLLDHIHPESLPQYSSLNWLCLFVAIICALYLLLLVLKWFGSRIYSFIV